MELDKVRRLNKKELLEKLEQNGLDLVANILRDKEINGEKLLALTEFETIKWRLPLSQKKMLFNCINELIKNPSTIMKGPTTPKPKYGVSKAPPPKPTRFQQKQPPTLNPKPKTSNFSEEQAKTAFKQKLGTLFDGSFEFKPVSSSRPLGLSGQAHSDGIPTPPRFRTFDSTQHKASYPDPAGFDNQVTPSNEIPTPPRFKKFNDIANDQIPARRHIDSEAKLPLPTPIELKTSPRATSPFKASNKNKQKLPLPVEPQKSIQATTLPRTKVVDPGKTRAMDSKPKSPLPSPMERQAPIPTRSSNVAGSRVKLPVPSSVETQTAQRKPALLPSKKHEVTPTPPKQKTLKTKEEEMYVDMCNNQLDSSYGYLSPIDIAASRSSSPFPVLHVPPFLPPRNASPNFQSHVPDEEEPTYHDPDETYEQAPNLNSFDAAPNIPPLSARGVDNSIIIMETRNQNRVTIDRNEDKLGNGFFKKLFKLKGKLIYENVEIERNMEHRVSISEKIQPRPLPPVPMQDAPPHRPEIPLGDPVGYIELTLQPPEAEELYANYDEKDAKMNVDESEEANYTNTHELQSRPHHFHSPLSTKKIVSKHSPDDLAAKLAQDLKARVWHSKEHSDDTDGSDFEIDPEEDEFSEQTYSNVEIEDSRALALKLETSNSANNRATEQQKQMRGAATNRNNPQIFPVDVNEELNEEIYINLPDSSSNIRQARPIPPPPAHINKTVTTEKGNRGGLNYSSPQFIPVRKHSIIEVEKEEEGEDQVYGNIVAESHPEKSQENPIFQISNEPYYRDTDRKGAKQLLRTLGNGAFLFRPSEKHFLVLSAKHNGKFYNFGIERSPNGKIRLTADSNSDVPEFSSLKEFVEYFSKEALTFQEETSLAEIFLRPVLLHDLF